MTTRPASPYKRETRGRTTPGSVLARIWIFFPKKELFKFFRELFAKEELSINDEIAR